MAWQQAVKKPAAKPAAPKPKFDTKDDDWETDTAYENSVTEKTQRYGSASIPGSGRVDHFDMSSIQDKIKTADVTVTSVYREKNPNRGYGGKYGTEQVMDKTAADFSYKADVKKHSSQTDGKKGFGGEHGVDERAKDQSAMGFDYKPTVEKHASQTDASKGFGGKFGIEQNTQDKAAVGTSHKESAPKPSSQTDHSVGSGSQQSAQKGQSSAAAAAPPSPSPAPPTASKVVEKPATAPASGKADVGNIRAKFENMKKEQEAEAAKRVAEERKKRVALDEQQSQQTVTATTSTSKSSNAEKPKQQATVSTADKVVLEESSAPLAKASTETVSENDENNASVPASIKEHDDQPVETPVPTTAEAKKEEELEKFVGGVNVTALLRQRKQSSSSSKNDDDEEWAADAN